MKNLQIRAIRLKGYIAMLVFTAFIMMLILLAVGMKFHLYLYRHGALTSPRDNTAEEQVTLGRNIFQTVPYRK